ncbi:hypothetical protein N7472_005859 [Penicillium cf. griseofulvum]|uniref:Uncharacterized protein n=1 Tax=Penicillium cf. griseofulvum TaxID=2972120 RepID=A0A9W9JU12_9EURO|nr:hypothetical protein N7472_005859 [Penicillium cf. griseofulvum]
MVQVQIMLGLKLAINDPELENVPPPDVNIANVLSMFDNATAPSLSSESSIRSTLDILLVYAHDIAISGNAASPSYNQRAN